VPEVEEEPIRETRDAHVQTDFFTPEMTLKRHTKSNIVWPTLELTSSSTHTAPTAATAAAAAAAVAAVNRASSAPQQLLFGNGSVVSNGSSTRSSTHFVPHIQRDEGGLWEGLGDTEPDVLFYTGMLLHSVLTLIIAKRWTLNGYSVGVTGSYHTRSSYLAAATAYSEIVRTIRACSSIALLLNLECLHWYIMYCMRAGALPMPCQQTRHSHGHTRLQMCSVAVAMMPV
jgi:hypothetical protein